MADKNLRDLERLAASGDTDAKAKLAAAKYRNGISAIDLEYLAKYMAICDEVMANIQDIRQRAGFRGHTRLTGKRQLTEDEENSFGYYLDDTNGHGNLHQPCVFTKAVAYNYLTIAGKKLAYLNDEYQALGATSIRTTIFAADAMAGNNAWYDSSC